MQQCPLIQRIAEANPRAIDLRWLDRDQHSDLQHQLVINGGRRVPVVLFLAEDFALAHWFGGRVLNVCALGDTRANARERALQACDQIHFDHAHYRRDIGFRVLEKT